MMRIIWFFIFCFVVSSCNEIKKLNFPDETVSAVTLELISQNDQSVLINTNTREFLVLILDQAKKPVADYSLSLSVLSGGGSLTSLKVVSDRYGIARISWKVGPSIGENSLQVEGVMDSSGAIPKLVLYAEAVSETGNTTVNVSQTHSTITAVGPVSVTAGTLVTIILKDNNNSPVIGVTPTFTASGTANTYGACSVTNASGVSTCSLSSTKAEIKTLSITSPIYKSDGSAAFTHGPAASLVVSTQPVGGLAPSLTSQPVIRINDTYGNIVDSGTDASAFISIALTSGTGTLGGTTSVAAVNGVASFTNLTVSTAGTKALTASGTLNGNPVSVISNNFTLTASAATKLVFSTQPSVTGTAGTALAQQPVVTVQDASSTVVSGSTDNITLELHANNTCTSLIATTLNGANSIGGVATRNAVNGVATFTGLAINHAATTLHLKASSGSLTSDCSSLVSITSGAVSLTESTLGVSAGTVASGSSVLATFTGKDSYGNLDPSGITTVSFQSASGSFSAPTNLGSGVYTSNFTGGTAGNVSLTSQVNGSLISDTKSVTVTAGSAAKVFFSTVPASTGIAGQVLSQQPVVHIRDANDNLVTSSSASVTVELHSDNTCTSLISTTPNSSAALSGITTVAASSGSAAFTNIVINYATSALYLKAASGALASDCSSVMNISSGAFSLADSTVTTSSATLNSGSSITVTVTARDIFGNSNPSGISGVTFTAPSGSFGSTTNAGNGVYTASFTGSTAGSVTLTGRINGSNIIDTEAVTVSAGSATQLSFSTQPASSATAGTALTTQPVVHLLDASNNLVSSETSTVTLNLYSDSACSTAVVNTIAGGASITGTNAVVASGGVASFTNVSINRAGPALYLQASSGVLTTACSNAISVASGAFSLTESILALSAGSVASGGTVTVTLTARDDFGNSTPSGVTTVTYSAGSGSFSATSGGAGVYTSTYTAGTAGNITISGLINGSLITDTESLTVGSGSAAKLVFSTQPHATGVAGVNLATQPVIQIQDANNNVVTSSSDTISLALYSNSTCTTPVATAPSGATSIANGTVAASSGVATFSGLNVRRASSALYLLASSGGLTTACSSLMNISSGNFSTADSTIDVSSATVVSGQSIVATLTARDAFGNSNPSGVSSVTFDSSIVGGTGTFGATTDQGGGIHTANFTGVKTGSVNIMGLINASTITDTESVTVNNGAATKVAFSTEPSSTGFADTALTTQPVVQILDANDNIVTSSSSSVSLALYADSGCSTTPVSTTANGSTPLGGTTSVSASSGVSTFSNVSIRHAAPALYLRASSGMLTPDCSTVTNISPGNFSLSESTLGVSASSVLSGSSIVVTLTVKDAYGNNNPSGIVLPDFDSTVIGGTGSFSATAGSNGVYTANFTGAVAGSVTLSGLVNSNPITATQTVTVNHGTASALAFTTHPVGAAAGVAFTAQPIVEIRDASGNRVSSGVDSTRTVSLTLQVGTGTLTTTTSVAAVSGVATFSGLTVNRSGAKTLRATATLNSVVQTVDSNSFTMSSSTPVATNTSDTINSNTPTSITLPYNNLDADPATSCSVSSLSNATVTTICSCSSGVCTVGISSSTLGAASFNFSVTANSLTSNSATASITVVSSDTAPVANNITPSDMVKDSEKFVTLSYTDAESDAATSCSVSSLSNVSVSTTCSCSAGVCRVGITPTGALSAAASFNYTVTANSATSNTATASFTIGDCPQNFVRVEPNSALGTTSYFCVAKYEMKCVGTSCPTSTPGANAVATSQAAGTPWVSLYWSDAKTACSNLNAINGVSGNYAMITNPQWMTIARDAELVNANWTSGTPGTGNMFVGHSDGSPNSAQAASTDDNDPYYLTGNSAANPSGSGLEQKRTHTLSNGSVIWDLGANVWEMIDWQVTPANKAYSSAYAVDSQGYRNFNQLDSLIRVNDQMAPKTWTNYFTSLTRSNGIGHYYRGTSSSGGTAIRGGDWNDGYDYNGLFALDLNGDTVSNSNIGFRCVFNPDSVPVIALQNPTQSTGYTSTPTFRVSNLTNGDTVSLYSQSNCGGTAVASGTAAGTTLDLTSSTLSVGSHQFSAQINSSYCTAAVSYTHSSCPTNYVPVPGNATLGTSDFCVMKYEAKNVAGVATSQIASTPWVNITAANAQTACSNLNTTNGVSNKYGLISNAEWMTIARNIEAQGSNWTGGVVNQVNQQLYVGQVGVNSNVALAAHASDEYSGTGHSAANATYLGKESRRTHYLSNGSVIWDFSGNVDEIVDWTPGGSYNLPPICTGAHNVQLASVSCSGLITNDYLPTSNTSWASNAALDAGVGYFFRDAGTLLGLARGGNFWDGGSAGIYTVWFYDNTYGTNHDYTGFRCVYRP